MTSRLPPSRGLPQHSEKRASRRGPGAAPARAPNKVRIIGGRHRGRILHFAAAEGLRPTPDRVRETLFNWLGQDLTGCACLDLFAGSGALGLEAASRGAREVTLVERSRKACAALEKSAEALGERAVRVVCDDALEFAARSGGRFDVVFVDPPYGSGLAERALALLPPLLAPGARVYFESDRPFGDDASWRAVKAGRAGAVHFHLLEFVDS
ncbi:MAG: 16S rRNA (guanine(966)-N(2))-methyltransferase RsmD [Burkholderiales bacterium]|jgi:16S rRNA (guanine966-N2)-methyltransferase|nr:16S rRNA (guanine(966)-N(2))-methyltransferase RsmD [Burkholderiales bacterium]